MDAALNLNFCNRGVAMLTIKSIDFKTEQGRPWTGARLGQSAIGIFCTHCHVVITHHHSKQQIEVHHAA